MKPPEDENIDSGGNPEPSDSDSSASDSTNFSDSESDDPEFEDDWFDDNQNEVGVVVRGSPSGYNLHFVLLIRLQPGNESEILREIFPLGTKNWNVIEQIDISNPPSELKFAFREARQRMRDHSSSLDNELIRQKFKNLFTSVLRGDELVRRIQNDSREDVHEFLKRRIQEECFPGTNTRLEVKLHKWDEESVSEADSSNSQESSENSLSSPIEDFEDNTNKRILTVNPRVKAIRGREIGRLRPGDIFEVRVVGESVTLLKSNYREEDSTNDKEGSRYSKPIRAKLISLEEGETPQDIEFLVRLGDGVYGRGVVTRDTRVLSNESLVKNAGILSSGFGAVILLILALSVLIVLLFLTTL